MVMTELERLRESFEKLDGEDLGVLYQGLDGELETVKVKIGVIRQVLTARMEADEALELDAGTAGTWSLVASYGWYVGELNELKEALTDDELRAVWSPETKIDIPATVQVIPEAFNLRKMKGLSKKGKKVAVILDNARVVKSRTLSLVAKDDEEAGE